MNVTKMPGFTAEASVYQTREHYQFATGRVPISSGLLPQLKDTDLPGATWQSSSFREHHLRGVHDGSVPHMQDVCV